MQLVQEVKVLMGLPGRWNTCSRTIPVEGDPSAFAHWGDIIAVGLESNRVVLLDAITGSRKSILSGHTDMILSLAFSLDGTLLVSGSEDKTIKIWDVQTGGVVRSFRDQSSPVLSVSVSPDHTRIASGAQDGSVRLWDVRNGKCHSIPERHGDLVTAVSFSPTNPRRLVSSAMDGTVRQWDVEGHKVGTLPKKATSVFHVTYTPDGTRFSSCGGTLVTVGDSESSAVVVKIDAPTRRAILKYGCFSLDGRFLACAAADTIYVWDISDSKARLVGNLVGHSKPIISIAFTSSLISLSLDRSVKFWQSSSFLTDSITTDNTSAQLDSAQIESVHLFPEDDKAVTSDSSGVVKTWVLSTGTYESSSPTPAQGVRDVHLAGDTLFVVWRTQDGEGYHVWDVKKREFRTLGSSLRKLLGLRISADGSKLFGLDNEHIEARCLQTGKGVGLVKHQSADPWRDALTAHGSKVRLENSKGLGWDFGRLDASGTPSASKEFPEKPRLSFVESARIASNPAWIEDTVTGRPIFYIPERYVNTGMKRQWDGRYLIFWSPSGEVVIMDFDSVCPR